MKYFLSLITFLIFTFTSSISWSEVGFRDLKIGSDTSVIDENCKKEENENGYFYRCFNIDDLTFQFSISEEKFINHGEGFKELRVGSSRNEVEKICVKEKSLGYVEVHSCYGMSFTIFFEEQDNGIYHVGWIERTKFNKINRILIDVGPLYQTVLDYVITDPENPYGKLKKSLNTNYELDWEFTERDRKLFNEGEKNSLWTSYNNGQVFSEITRVDRYSDLRLFVHYHTKDDGKKLSEERTPQNVDFKSF